MIGKIGVIIPSLFILDSQMFYSFPIDFTTQKYFGEKNGSVTHRKDTR